MPPSETFPSKTLLSREVFQQVGVGWVFADEEEQALDGFDLLVTREAAADDSDFVVACWGGQKGT